MKYFSWYHLVSFEETNLVGNVYFANHVRWQGKCREQFLFEHAPGILKRLQEGLALVTVRCSCDYLAELEAFDQVEVRMRLQASSRSQVSMDFEYWRLSQGQEALVARGQQQAACMERKGDEMVPVPIPTELKEALSSYRLEDRTVRQSRHES